MVAFGIARTRITEGIGASERAWQVVEDRIQVQSRGRLDSFWITTLEGFREIGKGEQNWKVLYERAVEFGKNNGTILELMFRVAAILNAGPSEAFQLTLYSFQRRMLPRLLTDAPYHVIVISFLCCYWRWCVETYAVHFSLPERTSKEITEVLRVPTETGLKSGLRIIADRLGIRLTEAQKEDLS
jgi:hypothetical protein